MLGFCIECSKVSNLTWQNCHCEACPESSEGTSPNFLPFIMNKIATSPGSRQAPRDDILFRLNQNYYASAMYVIRHIFFVPGILLFDKWKYILEVRDQRLYQ
jgi:hypothetical protein